MKISPRSRRRPDRRPHRTERYSHGQGRTRLCPPDPDLVASLTDRQRLAAALTMLEETAGFTAPIPFAWTNHCLRCAEAALDAKYGCPPRALVWDAPRDAFAFMGIYEALSPPFPDEAFVGVADPDDLEERSRAAKAWEEAHPNWMDDERWNRLHTLVNILDIGWRGSMSDARTAVQALRFHGLDARMPPDHETCIEVWPRAENAGAGLYSAS